MSYCRWSDYDFRCDVYCYHDVGGWWQIHVAAMRHVSRVPMPDPVDHRDVDAWVRRHTEVMRIIENADLVKIGLPLDGASFKEATPEDAADRLEEIRAAGYNVPQYAIDELREKAAEGAS